MSQVQILEGVRVVEFTAGMWGSLAGTVLADHGAEVIKVEPPKGSFERESAGFLMWNRGKQSVVLDLADAGDRGQARALALSADVVLENLPAGTLAEAGLSAKELRARRPDLIYCTVSGFGQARRLEHFGSDEPTVLARSGRLMGMNRLSGAHTDIDRPIYITSAFSAYGAAMLAVQGIVAALMRRKRSGAGDEVSTSVLDGTSAATMRLAFERKGDTVVPVAARNEASLLVGRGIQLCFLTAQTKDGRYIQMCSRAPHLYHNWMNAIGLGEQMKTERWKGLPIGLKSMADADEWEQGVRARMRQRTQAEWMELFRSIDVGGDPFLTFDEILDHPQVVQNGRAAVVQDPVHGPVREIGPLINFEATPIAPFRPAPTLGQHQAQLAALIGRQVSAQPLKADVAAQAPLAGFTILEFASFLAAPLGATLMAELGARVIKVEPLEGDMFRKTGLEYVHIGNGKESIALDMKNPKALEIVDRLVARSDVLLHNFRPGVPEKLGIGYERVSKVNPRLIYLYGASYGSQGPEKHRPAFHPMPNALTGGGILQGGRGNRPVNDSYSDPCAGLAVGAALAIGLYARELTGRGQYMETTMLTSACWVHSDQITNYRDRPARPELDQQQLGYGSLCRLYECAQGWIMLVARNDRQVSALARMFDQPAWAGVPASRLNADEAVAKRLGEIFKRKDAQQWEAEGVKQGVSIVSAADGTFEEFLVREKLLTGSEHPAFGTYWRLPPRVRFADAPNRLGEPCVAGEHSRPLLAECGFGEAAINELIQSGVVRAK